MIDVSHLRLLSGTTRFTSTSDRSVFLSDALALMGFGLNKHESLYYIRNTCLVEFKSLNSSGLIFAVLLARGSGLVEIRATCTVAVLSPRSR